MDKLTGNIFPKKYENEFTVTQNKDVSVKGKEKRDTNIYDTFGFNVRSKSVLNFKISKILLFFNFQNLILFLFLFFNLNLKYC